MKILNVTPYPPVPAVFGGALRIHHLLRWMVQHHDVHLLSYGTPDDGTRVSDAFGIPEGHITMVPDPIWLGERWKRLGQLYALARNTSFTEIASRNRNMQRALDRCLARTAFELIQIAYPVMGYFRFRSDAFRVLDAANVEYDIHRRAAGAPGSRLRRLWSAYEYRKLKPQEAAICREQDMILVPSERDRSLLDHDAPAVPKMVIPNGVDMGYFTPGDVEPDPQAIIFTGAINYHPNTDAVVRFAEEILPLILRERPDTTFYVVGNAPPEAVRRLASPHVVVTGFVEDVRPYIRRAAVYVVPMRIGGGTRLKVLEAMAMQRPIVTTSIGSEGIDVEHGRSVLIADDPRSFAEATLRLLRDADLRRRLVAAGFDLVRTHYDWRVVGTRLGEAYERLRRPVPLAPETSR